jgi:hypothetical protein
LEISHQLHGNGLLATSFWILTHQQKLENNIKLLIKK